MLDYAWLMLLFPALGTLIIALFGTRLGKRVISWLAPGMVLLSFGVAVWMFVTLLGLPAEDRSHEVLCGSGWSRAISKSTLPCCSTSSRSPWR